MELMAEYADLDVVFDCADPDGVARFWMEALPGHEFPHGPPEGYETWEHWADANNIPEDQRNRARTLVARGANSANDFFNQVPEPKVAKNRVHLDIKVAHGLSDDARRPRIEAETTRLMAAGAGVVQ
jgi:hypothetical protein